jgi:hypothetical protein
VETASRKSLLITALDLTFAGNQVTNLPSFPTSRKQKKADHNYCFSDIIQSEMD